MKVMTTLLKLCANFSRYVDRCWDWYSALLIIKSLIWLNENTAITWKSLFVASKVIFWEGTNVFKILFPLLFLFHICSEWIDFRLFVLNFSAARRDRCDAISPVIFKASLKLRRKSGRFWSHRLLPALTFFSVILKSVSCCFFLHHYNVKV